MVNIKFVKKGGDKMKKIKGLYATPSVTIFSAEDICAIEKLAACSGCGGKCHRGSN